ncbi:MAG TPA: HEAT repeat domain-containing protein [Myxococcaceae bacterium]|nr:HEAT repeat domain-containing protein [Myxococcaceae bacterium]
MKRSPLLLAAVLAALVACRPAPHLVERVEVVGASVADAPLLGTTAAQLQAALQRRIAAEPRLKLLPAGARAPEGAPVVRLLLELSGVREVVRTGHEGPEVEVIADLTLRRKTESGTERTELWASGAVRPMGQTFEDRQDAARRALDQALDDLVRGARAQLDALDQPDKVLVRDLDSPDPRTRDAALDVLAARKHPRSVPVLLERLQSDDPLEVRRAMGALVEMRATQAVPALIDLARDKDPGFLRELVYALGAIGGDEARAYLYTVAQGHDSPVVREAAQRALDELTQRAVRAQEQLQGASAEAKRSPSR